MSRPSPSLPAHVYRDRARWVRMVEARPDLTHGAKRYARALAFRQWGPGQVGWARRAAAKALGCAVRSIVRWNDELCAAGVLHLAQRGGIRGGRRWVNVFGLLFPQVGKGDRKSPPTGRRQSYRHRATRRGLQLTLEIPIPDRTTASRPAPDPGRTPLPAGARAAGDG
jgi:hypothetical protein